MDYTEIGIFEKLNDNMRYLAIKLLEDQEFCKLVYYPNNNPLDQPNVNGAREILDKRLLLFTPKLPQAKETGTFVTIIPTPIRSDGRGNLTMSTLRIDIYTHHETRLINYKNKVGKNIRNVDRVLLIMDKICDFISKSTLSIGRPKFQFADYVGTNSATFSGYQMVYKDIDFTVSGGYRHE